MKMGQCDMSTFVKFLEKITDDLGLEFEIGKIKAEEEYELAANILAEKNYDYIFN